MITTKNIPEQLVDIYLTEQWWVNENNVIPRNSALKYYDKLYKQGNIIIHQIDEEIVGYVEAWKINFEQFGKIICHAPLCGDGEDILSGNIAYVANVWINPKYRNSLITQTLKYKFYKFCHNCDYYCGVANRKKTGLVKVFKKSELSSKLFKEGEI